MPLLGKHLKMAVTKSHILIADDDDDIRLALSLLLAEQGYKVSEAANGKEIARSISQPSPDLVLLDMNFSRDTTNGQEGLEQLSLLQSKDIAVVLMTAWGSVDLAVKGMQQGAGDFIEKPWNKQRLLQVIEQQLKLQSLKDQNNNYLRLLTGHPQAWVCESPAMQALETMVLKIASTDANVLILGENGTGKSLLAERIHKLSRRSAAPLVALNMASIPESLFESELFGHKKGAFTDANVNRTGRFELAQGSSLFMDEIGTLPLNLQAKLLRVLESGEFEVLGSSKTQFADVRIISATNADLNDMVARGGFRQDLLFRLNTIILTLPPLRQRKQDIATLAELFVNKFSNKYQRPQLSLTQNAMEKLLQYTWPGNIRELSHTIERAVLLCPNREIDANQLSLHSGANIATQEIDIQPLEHVEQQLIHRALEVSQGNVTAAAQLLKISRSAFYRRMDKFGIEHDT